MTAAAAPAPSMFAVFRRRDFSPVLARPADLDGRVVADRPGRRHLGLPRDRVGPGRRPDPDGDGDPEPRRRPVGRRLRRPARPQADHGHDLPHPVGHRRPDRAHRRDRLDRLALYALLLLNAGVKQFFDPAHDSLIPEMATDEELTAANAFLSIASFGSTAIGFAGAGLLASTVGLTWAFIIDAVSFLVCAGLHRLMGRYPMPMPDDEAQRRGHRRQPEGRAWRRCSGRRSSARCSSSARSCSWRSACGTCSCCRSRSRGPGRHGVRVRAPGGPDLGRLRRRFALHGAVLAAAAGARVDRRLAGRRWACSASSTPTRRPSRSPSCRVTDPGFAQPPSSVSRSVLLQRNTPREMRGRVFSAFYVMRDVIFLIGMAGAGLADVVDIRILIVFASSLLFVSAAFTLVAPGLGVSTWRAAAARLRGGRGRSGPGREPGPGGHPGRLRSPGRPARRRSAGSRRSSEPRSFATATVRDVPAGTRVVEHGETASSAYFILDGSTTAGIPTEDGYRGLSTMTAGRLLRRDRGPDRQPADGRRRGRRRLDAARGAGRRAARHDGGARDPAARPLDACRAGSSGPRPPTCRAWPASTRRRCATCGRRARAPSRSRRVSRWPTPGLSPTGFATAADGRTVDAVDQGAGHGRREPRDDDKPTSFRRKA